MWVHFCAKGICCSKEKLGRSTFWEPLLLYSWSFLLPSLASVCPFGPRRIQAGSSGNLYKRSLSWSLLSHTQKQTPSVSQTINLF